MAFVVPENVAGVLAVADEWEIDAAVIGEVKPGDRLTVRHHGEVVADVPATSLGEDAPVYERPATRPDWLDEVQARNFDGSALDVAKTLLDLLSDPGIGSSAWVHEQYDHMLFLNTVVGPGADGSLLRIKGTNKALAVSTDGNGRLCYLDPRRGAARLVYEAALNVAVVGARPLALVDNLNFGNPEKPSVMWQFAETVDGISEACETLGIPVVGGNVSFYNETDGSDIHPTPVVGLLGLADPAPADPARLRRAIEGMEIWLIGPDATGNLAGSAVQRLAGELSGLPTEPDPASALAVVELAAEMAHHIPVLHDVSDGGIAVAITEICIASGVGATLEAAHPFSEDPHRFLAVATPGAVTAGDGQARKIGSMGGDRISINGASVPLAEAARRWRQAIPAAIAG